MREQSINHSDPIPNAENWILVSDPFERPKVYRHKDAVFKIADGESGVHVFVSDEPGSAPLLLHDIKDLGAKGRLQLVEQIYLYTAPTLRLILGGETIEMGKVYQIPPTDDAGFLEVTFFVKSSVESVSVLTNICAHTPYRLKLEEAPNHKYQESNPKSFRGTLDESGTLALRQAVILYDHFQRKP